MWMRRLRPTSICGSNLANPFLRKYKCGHAETVFVYSTSKTAWRQHDNLS